jgi:tRNA-intron endonuclease
VEEGKIQQELQKISGEGLLAGNTVVITDSEFASKLAERGYGIKVNSKLELSLVEATYLVHRGILKVRNDKGEEIRFSDLVRLAAGQDPDFWLRLNVYADLRNRALIVRHGVHPHEFVIDWKKKNKPRRLLVRILCEGTKVGFPEFEEMFRRALESDRELVVAIVDKEGVVTYYLVEGGSYEQVSKGVEDSFEVSSE